MTEDEKQLALENMQKYIDSLPWESTINYVYCALCFEKLTPQNILEKDDKLWNVCLDCKDK